MITEQYRMHPEISQYPSKAFYESRLLNAPCVLSRSETAKIGALAASRLPRYAFLDLATSREDTNAAGKSHSNLREAQ